VERKVFVDTAQFSYEVIFEGTDESMSFSVRYYLRAVEHSLSRHWIFGWIFGWSPILSHLLWSVLKAFKIVLAVLFCMGLARMVLIS